MNAKEQRKEKDERSALVKFASRFPKYAQAEISKQVRPDYVLKMPDGKLVGVEITQFTTETDKVIKRIAEDYAGSDKDISTIRNEVIREHGQKAERYTYRELAGKPAIGSGPFLIRERKAKFALQIIGKYEKYESIIDGFDHFIVLCDARDGLNVTDEEDAKEIIEMALQKKLFLKSFKIAILYSSFGNVDTNYSCYLCTVNVVSLV